MIQFSSRMKKQKCLTIYMRTFFLDCVEPTTLFDFGRCISYYPNAVSPNNLEAAEEFCQQKMIFSGRVLPYTSQNCNLLFVFIIYQMVLRMS